MSNLPLTTPDLRRQHVNGRPMGHAPTRRCRQKRILHTRIPRDQWRTLQESLSRIRKSSPYPSLSKTKNQKPKKPTQKNSSPSPPAKQRNTISCTAYTKNTAPKACTARRSWSREKFPKKRKSRLRRILLSRRGNCSRSRRRVSWMLRYRIRIIWSGLRRWRVDFIFILFWRGGGRGGGGVEMCKYM